MRFAEFLVQEAFTSPYPFRWDVSDDNKGWLGDFTSKDGDKITVVFSKVFGKDRAFEIIFSANGKIEPTAKQDAFRIFATVLAMTKEVIDKLAPNRLVFSAFKDEEEGRAAVSRTKLYVKLCTRFAESNGYTFKRVEHNGYDDFELTRKPD
jgi:hypothetical protein